MNISVVEEHTKTLAAAGIYVLQLHRFAETEVEHVRRLARWAEFPAGRIIDMGSGTGKVAQIMAEDRPDLNIWLVNIADQGPCDYKCSFLNVPEPDGSFAGAMFCFSIGHEDHRAALWEAARLLRKGGVLFIYDMVSAVPLELPGMDYHVEPAISHPAFVLDFYMEPRDRFGFGLNPEAFAGTRPAVWRFIRC